MNKVIKRGFKDSYNLSKPYYATLVTQGIFEGLSPMIVIVFSQIIINNLARKDSFESIISTVIVFLIVSFLILVINGIFKFFSTYQFENYVNRVELARNQKMIDMDYKYIENPEIIALRRQVTVQGFSSDSSFENLPTTMRDIVKNVTTILVSLALLFPVFASQTGTQLDSLLYPLGFVLYIIMSFTLPFLHQKNTMKKLAIFQEKSYSINLSLNYIINTLFDHETGKEIRIYKLQTLFKNLITNAIRSGDELFTLYYNKTRTSSLISTLIAQGGSLLLIIFVTLKIIYGSLGPGHIVSSMTSLNMLLTALPVILISVTTLLGDTSALESHYKYMDLENQSESGSLPIEKRLDNDYELKVNNLDFAFATSESNTLEDININFENGKSYAIVGENGSGKTTFIKLLTRLYAPSSGNISLNDIDIKKYKADEYYSLFNVVFQDFSLFSFTLGETIATSKTYDSNDLTTILEEVGFAKRLSEMNHGLDTIISKSYDPSGIGMSGGEKQKLAIARAIYKAGPIYILDEPTSALDPISEFEIYEQFNRITQEKTSIFISHRLSSCRFCDEILVFDEGHIVQQGTHDTLVKEVGKYQELWNAQAQYYV